MATQILGCKDDGTLLYALSTCSEPVSSSCPVVQQHYKGGMVEAAEVINEVNMSQIIT